MLASNGEKHLTPPKVWSDRCFMSQSRDRTKTDMAQQPTDFTINIFELNEVFSNPALISSLALFSEERQSLSPSSFVSDKRQSKTSLLFLKVNAKAAYFTSNTTLLTNVPLVAVDLSTLRVKSDELKS